MLNSLAEKVRGAVPFLGGRSRPGHKAVMALSPVRHPGVTWERSGETGLIVLRLARSRTRLWDRLIGKIFQIPTDRKIELSDELSSLVWEQCDGRHSVGAIATHIAREYKLTQRQAEVSVLAFLNTLQSKRLVGIPQQQADKLKGRAAAKTAETKGTKGFYAGRKQRAKPRVARERGH